MRKYSFDEKLPIHISIANELAEMNRLKRLEMQHNLGMITSRKDMKEELEDQA